MYTCTLFCKKPAILLKCQQGQFQVCFCRKSIAFPNSETVTWSILSSTFYFPPFLAHFFLLLSLQIYSGILKPENVCNCLFITYFSLNVQLLCLTSRIPCNQSVRLWIPSYSKQVRTQNRQLTTFSVTFMNEEKVYGGIVITAKLGVEWMQ